MKSQFHHVVSRNLRNVEGGAGSQYGVDHILGVHITDLAISRRNRCMRNASVCVNNHINIS